MYIRAISVYICMDIRFGGWERNQLRNQGARLTNASTLSKSQYFAWHVSLSCDCEDSDAVTHSLLSIPCRFSLINIGFFFFRMLIVFKNIYILFYFFIYLNFILI